MATTKKCRRLSLCFKTDWFKLMKFFQEVKKAPNATLPLAIGLNIMEYLAEIEEELLAARLPGDCGCHEHLQRLLCFNVPTCVDPNCVYYDMLKTGNQNPRAVYETINRRSQTPTVGVTPTANGCEDDCSKATKRRHQGLDDAVESARLCYVGFLNLNNTYYVNATLQALLSLTEFVSDLSDVYRQFNSCSQMPATTLNDACDLNVFVPIAAAELDADPCS